MDEKEQTISDEDKIEIEEEDLQNEDVEIELEEEESTIIGDNLKKLSPDNKGKRPEYRVLQLDVDKDGKSKFIEVGAMWVQESSKTKEQYYILKLGKLKLFVFKNNRGELNERS